MGEVSQALLEFGSDIHVGLEPDLEQIDLCDAKELGDRFRRSFIGKVFSSEVAVELRTGYPHRLADIGDRSTVTFAQSAQIISDHFFQCQVRSCSNAPQLIYFTRMHTSELTDYSRT